MGRVLFVIPVRHPSDVRDPDAQVALLAQTLRSVTAQDDRRFHVVIAGNPDQPLPPLPPQVTFQPVDLPPNAALHAATSRIEAWQAIQRDKGERVRAALAHARPDDFVMVVDDDDLVSRRIVGFVLGQPERKGWHVDRGFVWTDAGPRLSPIRDLFQVCGSTLILPVEYYAHVGDPSVPEDLAVRELGSHKLIFERRTLASGDHRPLPFPAAIYRVGHDNSSQADVRMHVRPSLRTRIRGALSRAARGVKTRLRDVPLDPRLHAEFFGAPTPTS